MARSDSLKSEIARLRTKGAGLSRDLAKHRDTAAKANAAASKKRTEASRTKSDVTQGQRPPPPRGRRSRP